MSSEALCHFIGNGSSHGLLGKGLVVVEVVVLNDTFQSDKTAVAAHFSKRWLYFILGTLPETNREAARA
jgi:hypothetical protein